LPEYPEGHVLSKPFGRDDMHSRIDGMGSCSLHLGLGPPGVCNTPNRLGNPRLRAIVIKVYTDQGTDARASELTEGDGTYGA
jgi:hypothetical protein